MGREAVIDRTTMRATDEYAYQVLPPVQPLELIDTDFDGLVSGPYALSVEAVLAYLETIAAALQDNSATLDRAREISRRTSLHPDLYLDGAFATLQFGLDAQSARAMVDN